MPTVVLSLLVEDVDARRKVLRGRKAITRQYYSKCSIPCFIIPVNLARGVHKCTTVSNKLVTLIYVDFFPTEGTAIPAWSISLIVGLCMLGVGGGLYALGSKIIDKQGGDSAV